MDSQSLPPAQGRTLLNAFTTFLTLTVHTILYHRALYPAETFLLAKHHNLPVHQSRHPGLCTWINDSVAQVRILLAHGRLARVSINIHTPHSLSVCERWVFDVARFPSWVDEDAERARTERFKGKEVVRPSTWAERDQRAGRKALRTTEQDREMDERGVNWRDVDESIRGALRRVAYAAETKGPAEEGCTFTIAVELREDVKEVPGDEWIPSQPDQQPTVIRAASPGAHASTSTTPLRTVQAGPLFFECWVEESSAAETPKASAEPPASSLVFSPDATTEPRSGIPSSLLDADFSQDSEYP